MIPSTWKGYWKVSPSLLSSTLSKVVPWTVGYNAFQVALLLLTYGQFRVRWLAMTEGQYLDSYCHFYSYTFGQSSRDLRNTNTSPLFSILMFVSSCTVFNNRAVFNRKRTNYSDQSQQKQTVQWANQNTRSKARKNACAINFRYSIENRSYSIIKDGLPPDILL